MEKKSALWSVLNAKCPRCREGDVFTDGVLNLKKVASTHENCPKCGLRYEKEPGALYGAMYVSYAISTGIFLVASFILYFFFNNPPTWVYIVSVVTISLLIFPFNYRYSKILFLYMIWKN